MVSGTEPPPNAAEAKYWASPSGLSWIENEVVLDELLAPVTEMALGHANLKPGDHVLDIGCGTGAHAIEAAKHVGSGGKVVALDISLPLLNRASERASASGTGAPVEFMNADAQTVDLGARRFDHAVSRFGVMFFADPAAAFSNIARAIKPGGQMVFAAWGPVAVNPWWRLPGTIAKARLGEPPATEPNAPGPMGLSDVDYTKAELGKAGFGAFRVDPVTVDIAHTGGASAMSALSMRVGPAARLMRLFDGNASDAKAIEDDLTRAYQAYEDDGGFRMPATINLITVQLP